MPISAAIAGLSGSGTVLFAAAHFASGPAHPQAGDEAADQAASAGSQTAPQPAPAQPPEGPVRRLTAEEAVAMALENNLGLRADRLDPQIQDLNVASARAAFTPELFSTIRTTSDESPSSSFLAGAAETITDDRFSSNLGVRQNVPWGGGTEVTAVFRSAQNLRPNSPVRIAGVEVGKVTSVEPLAESQDSGGVGSTGATANGSGAVVKMEIDDEGLPLKEDARFELKPRLFLEGNLFVDLSPGSPGAPEADDGYTFPVQQTATSVQLDQVLTTLQSDVRTDLQILLDQFGNAGAPDRHQCELRRDEEAVCQDQDDDRDQLEGNHQCIVHGRRPPLLLPAGVWDSRSV